MAHTRAARRTGMYLAPMATASIPAADHANVGTSSGQFGRIALVTLFAHMFGTVTPLVLFPNETWPHVPYAATLEGQYILKNMVLVSAAFVVSASVHVRELARDPEMSRAAAGPHLVDAGHVAI